MFKSTMSNDEKTCSEDIHLENLPIKPTGSAQYYTCEDGQERSKNEQNETAMEEQLLEIDVNPNGMTLQETSKWRYAALSVSWVSIVVLLFLGILSFVCSQVSDSSAAFGFGFDCLLDVATSAVVVWRFIGSVGTVYSPEKERIALLFLGAVFIVAAVSIFARTIPDFIQHTETINDIWLYYLGGFSMVICLGLAITKFIIAKKLNSKSLQSDGYSSLAGAVTTLSMIISCVVTSLDSTVWYLDEIIGVIVGLLLLIYGIKLLVDTTQNSELKAKLRLHLPCRKTSSVEP